MYFRYEYIRPYDKKFRTKKIQIEFVFYRFRMKILPVHLENYYLIHLEAHLKCHFYTQSVFSSPQLFFFYSFSQDKT